MLMLHRSVGLLWWHLRSAKPSTSAHAVFTPLAVGLLAILCFPSLSHEVPQATDQWPQASYGL